MMKKRANVRQCQTTRDSGKKKVSAKVQLKVEQQVLLMVRLSTW